MIAANLASKTALVTGGATGATIGAETEGELARRGNAIERPLKPLGGCQAIYIDHAEGVLIGGAEPRKDGLALGY